MKRIHYIILSLILVFGCKEVKDKITEDKFESDKFGWRHNNVKDKGFISDEEYTLLGRVIQDSLRSGNSDFVKNVFHYPSFAGKINVNEQGKRNKAFISEEVVYERATMMNVLANSLIEETAFYDFLRLHKKGNILHLLFRFHSTNGGFDYHDYEIKEIQGKLFITDIYIYGTGEYLSKTMQEIMAVLSKDEKLLKQEKELGDKVVEMRESFGEGEFEEALNIYNELPEKLQKTKAMQMYYLSILALSRNENYAKAIDDYEKQYPNDSGLDFVLLDGFSINGEYEKSLECIDNLDKIIGGDSYLNFHRGILYGNMEQWEESKACLIKLLEKLPEFELGYTTLIETCIMKEDDADALIYLEKMMEKFDYSFDKINTRIEKVYPELFEKEIYKKWVVKMREK